MTPPPDRYSELNAALVEAAEQATTCRRLRSRLDSKRDRLVELQGQLPALEQQVAMELKDVEQLEGLSLAAVWTALFGDRDAKLERERKEYFEARLRLESTRAEIEKLQAEIAETERQLVQLGDAEERYEALLAGKEALVRSSDDEVAAEWSVLSDQLRAVRAELREIREAEEAGRLALYEIEAMRASLESATKWGWFTLVGGWFLFQDGSTDMLQQALYQAATVQQALDDFTRELADVSVAPLPDVDAVDVEHLCERFARSVHSVLLTLDQTYEAVIDVARIQRAVGETLDQVRKLGADTQTRADELQHRVDVLVFTAE